jgi:squalene cyclase
MYTKAVAWLKSIQHDDGGWGEDNQSYHDADCKQVNIHHDPEPLLPLTSGSAH